MSFEGRKEVDDVPDDIEVTEDNLVGEVRSWRKEFHVKFWLQIKEGPPKKRAIILQAESDEGKIISLAVNRKLLLLLIRGDNAERKRVARAKSGRFYYVKIAQKEISGEVNQPRRTHKCLSPKPHILQLILFMKINTKIVAKMKNPSGEVFNNIKIYAGRRPVNAKAIMRDLEFSKDSCAPGKEVKTIERF